MNQGQIMIIQISPFYQLTKGKKKSMHKIFTFYKIKGLLLEDISYFKQDIHSFKI